MLTYSPSFKCFIILSYCLKGIGEASLLYRTGGAGAGAAGGGAAGGGGGATLTGAGGGAGGMRNSLPYIFFLPPIYNV